MQFTVRLFGLEFLFVDLSDTTDEVEEALDYTTYPVGFVARMDVPDMSDLPSRE